MCCAVVTTAAVEQQTKRKGSASYRQQVSSLQTEVEMARCWHTNCSFLSCPAANQCNAWMGSSCRSSQGADRTAVVGKHAGACVVPFLSPRPRPPQASCEAVKTLSLEHPGTSCVEIRRDHKLFVSGGWDHRRAELKHGAVANTCVSAWTFALLFSTVFASLERSVRFLAAERMRTAFPMSFVAMPMHKKQGVIHIDYVCCVFCVSH